MSLKIVCRIRPSIANLAKSKNKSSENKLNIFASTLANESTYLHIY